MWIKQSKEAENGGLPSFIREFGLKKELGHAELAITATGIFSAKINGREIPDLFMPGWTNYNKYVNLCVYDYGLPCKKQYDRSYRCQRLVQRQTRLLHQNRRLRRRTETFRPS